MNNLNKKLNSIKLKYKVSQTSIKFFDTEVSIQNNKNKIYRKNTDRQNFLHIDSDHRKSLKDSIPYIHVHRIKGICTTPNNFNHYGQELKQKFVRQGYQPQLINKHIKAVEKMDRKELLKERDNTTPEETEIPLVLTNTRSLPNISKVIRKQWKIVSLNKAFKEIFQNEPVTAFRRNKNFRN